MARKLKAYQTSVGFYDLAIAAPSMKAALEAWGAGSNLFHQGFAKESEDPDVVAATMAAPGIVLRRAVGSDGPFREHADLPSNLVDIQHDEANHNVKKAGAPAARRKGNSESCSSLREARATPRNAAQERGSRRGEATRET